MVTIKPLHDRVLVKVDKTRPEKTPGGIYLPHKVKDDSPIEIAEVIDVGEGVYKEGVFIVPKCNIGDKVIFGSFTGANLDNPIGFEDYMLVRDSDILAKIVETNEDLNFPL
jgi:co-chaperonin GroES (HSP10)